MKKSLNRKNHYFVKIAILVIFSVNSDFLAKKSLNEKITGRKIPILVIISFSDFFAKKILFDEKITKIHRT